MWKQEYLESETTALCVAGIEYFLLGSEQNRQLV